MTELAPSQPLPPANTRPALDLYLGIAAAGLAWMAATYRVGPTSQWDGDFRLVQALSGQSLGWDGIISASVSRLLVVLPWGTLVTRVALTSAVASALVSWQLFRLCSHYLTRAGRTGPSRAWLSFGTALLFSVSPTTALAAASPPGPLLALAGFLGALDCAYGGDGRNREDLMPTRRDFLVGLLVATTLLEQFWIGVLTLVALLPWFQRSRRASIHSVQLALLGLGVTLASIGAPWLVTRRTVLSQMLVAGRPDPMTLPRLSLPSLSSLDGFFQDLGLLTVLLSTIGLLSLLRGNHRSVTVSLLALALPSLCLTFPDEVAPATKLLALASLVILSAVGLHQLVEWFGRQRRSPKALGSTLAVIAQLTACLAHADTTGFLVDRYADYGTEAFTHELLASTKPRAVLLLREPKLVRRVLSAQFTLGLRPDLLVVPVEVATNRAVAAELLRREPAMAATLRELTINGRPSEFSLSSLADERPVYLEFDPDWDRRLREHLLPLPFLHRLHSQTLGRSDRAQVLELSEKPIARIIHAIALSTNGVHPETQQAASRVTLLVLDARLREQLTLLLNLGDRQTFDSLFATYERLYPKSPWAAKLRPRLLPGLRSLDAFDLLTPPAAPITLGG